MTASSNPMLGLALVAALALPAISHAQFSMTASDSLGNSSFNTAGNWSSAAAPVAGSTYSTAGFLLRSPASGTAFTFAGDSLTVGGGSGAGAFSPVTANNNALIFKVSGMSLTVNNLILDGSQIRDGLTDNNTATLNGNISVTANGGSFIAQALDTINSSISGSGPLFIGDNGNGGAGRTIFFTSGASTYNGSITLTNSHAAVAFSRLTFSPGSVMNFTIGANGVNNRIGGQGTLALNGNLAFNLTGADNTVGDSWSIIDQVNSSVSYGSTFGINGFSQNGTVWFDLANGVYYQYDTTTGLLSANEVPEPAVCTLALLAGGLLLRRRAKNG